MGQARLFLASCEAPWFYKMGSMVYWEIQASQIYMTQYNEMIDGLFLAFQTA